MEKIKTQENIDMLLEEVEWDFSLEISNHFFESIFEDGINTIRVWMKTITSLQQEIKESWLI